MIDNQIMSAVLDVGEAMLTSGGEVSRIEQMMTRMCKAYGRSGSMPFRLRRV